MRSRTIRWVSSKRAWSFARSSGVIFKRRLFAIVVLLEQAADQPNVDLDVREDPHDSRDVPVADWRIHGAMVPRPATRRKWPIRTGQRPLAISPRSVMHVL